jgi:hypothetical protein
MPEKPHEYLFECRELPLASARRSRGGRQRLPKSRVHHEYCVVLFIRCLRRDCFNQPLIAALGFITVLRFHHHA